MKDITTEEKIAFFQAMKKNNLPYREEPRSKEEIEDLVFVHNSATKQYYSVKKGTKLSENETIVSSFDIFNNITKSIDVIVSESDDYTM